MNLSSQFSSHARTALILGGGGSTGNAWLIGVIAGLHEAGLDVTDADLIVGTSAGSTTAAQVTSVNPVELFAQTIATAPPRRPSAGGAAVGAHGSVVDHMDRMARITASSTDAADLRRRMGSAALERAAASEGSGEWWRRTVASRLPSQTWPAQRILITAVDARTGEPVVFDRDSGIELVDAVAASCSSSVAYPVGVDYYIDGGYRSNAENADLAAGYGRVLVLAPFGGRALTPSEWGTHLVTQLAGLRATGSRVETIFPEPGSEHLFGVNAMDPSLRSEAARAGHAQGRALAPALSEFWLAP